MRRGNLVPRAEKALGGWELGGWGGLLVCFPHSPLFKTKIPIVLIKHFEKKHRIYRVSRKGRKILLNTVFVTDFDQNH